MTKQFVALFILVVITIIAVVTFVNIVIYETGRTYDMTFLFSSIFNFLDAVAFKLIEQDFAMEAWIAEATLEVQQAEAELFFWNSYIFNLING